ncbi:glycosyltransferase family 9 protein [Bacteroidota bacterium]
MRNLKNQGEDVEIHYLTKACYTDLLKANPYIDEVHGFEGSVSKWSHKLKYEHFDYIIDLHNNIRSRRFLNKLKVLSFSVDKINIKKWLIVNFKINRLPDKHIVDRYLETLKIFDVINDGKGLDYFIPDIEEIDLSVLPEHFQKGYIAFSIGGKHNTKKLPVEKIISLCNKLTFPVLLMGGEEDKENGLMIVENTGKNVVNACGMYSIHQSASLIKQAKYVISHDTGLMHIAAAFNKQIISIWGNTIPAFGMYPYLSENTNSESFIIQVNNLKCRPCSKIGFSKCPKKHFKCMQEIDEERIINICNNKLNK